MRCHLCCCGSLLVGLLTQQISSAQVRVMHAVGAVVAGAIVFYIRRKKAAERNVDVTHVYASGQSSPVGNGRMAWFKRKLPRASSSHLNTHEQAALVGATPGSSRGPEQLLGRSEGGSSAESSRVQTAMHKVISLGASSHRNASAEGHSQTGGSSTGILGSPASWAKSRRSPAAGADLRALPLSTQLH